MGIEKATLRLVLSLGLAQTIAWASSFYLPAVLARPMAESLGCSVSTVYAAFSAALIVAALTAPFAGKYTDARGGKRVLVASNVWFALSLVFLSQAQGKASLFLGWASLGVAMGAGLYDMAFASVVRSRGAAAPPVIAGITLLAGFASTLGWPVSHSLLSHFGWRHVLLAWAGVHLFLALPLNLSLVLPMHAQGTKAQEPDVASPGQAEKNMLPAMLVLALAFVFVSFCSGAMAGHLPGLLQLFGVSAAASILAGMAFGPAQVSARLLLLSVQQKVQPISAAILAVFIIPLGAVLLVLAGPGAAALVAVTHGFGNGIMSIIKGTLPLSIFGEKGYGRRQGVLFLPAGIALACSPFLFSLCIEALGEAALYVYIAAAWTAMLLFLLLRRLAR
ncbi:MAG: MFS transporter [Desulfovibrionaceae bacterium]|nr:MFS transporter [Desulfovibrionaceae bacterium]